MAAVSMTLRRATCTTSGVHPNEVRGATLEARACTANPKRGILPPFPLLCGGEDRRGANGQGITDCGHPAGHGPPDAAEMCSLSATRDDPRSRHSARFPRLIRTTTSDRTRRQKTQIVQS